VTGKAARARAAINATRMVFLKKLGMVFIVNLLSNDEFIVGDDG
jgi:hypothetical protein